MQEAMFRLLRPSSAGHEAFGTHQGAALFARRKDTHLGQARPAGAELLASHVEGSDSRKVEIMFHRASVLCPRQPRPPRQAFPDVGGLSPSPYASSVSLRVVCSSRPATEKPLRKAGAQLRHERLLTKRHSYIFFVFLET